MVLRLYFDNLIQRVIFLFLASLVKFLLFFSLLTPYQEKLPISYFSSYQYFIWNLLLFEKIKSIYQNQRHFIHS